MVTCPHKARKYLEDVVVEEQAALRDLMTATVTQSIAYAHFTNFQTSRNASRESGELRLDEKLP